MRSRTMPGSLAARAFLLAYDLDRQRTTGDQLPLVVRGALLVELSLRGGLTVDDNGKVRASGTIRTGDEVMDGVLRTISEARPRAWRSWIRVNSRQTLCAVRRQLADAGAVSLDVDRVLGIFPRTRVTMREPAAMIEQRQSLRAVVAGTRPASDQDAALVALVAVGQVSATLSKTDRKLHSARIGELTEQGEAAAPALRIVLRQIKAARTAAQAGG